MNDQGPGERRKLSITCSLCKAVMPLIEWELHEKTCFMKPITPGLEPEFLKQLPPVSSAQRIREHLSTRFLRSPTLDALIDAIGAEMDRRDEEIRLLVEMYSNFTPNVRT